MTLLKTEEALRQALNDCESLKTAATQLEEAKSTLDGASNRLAETQATIERLAKALLAASDALKALNPETLTAKLERINEQLDKQASKTTAMIVGAAVVIVLVQIMLALTSK